MHNFYIGGTSIMAINSNGVVLNANVGSTHNFNIGDSTVMAINSDGTSINSSLSVNGSISTVGQLNFNNYSYAPPSIGSGTGDRITLFPSGSDYPYSIGIDATTSYYSVPVGAIHNFYIGGTSIMAINSNGAALNGGLNIYSSLPTVTDSYPTDGQLVVDLARNGAMGGSISIRNSGGAGTAGSAASLAFEIDGSTAYLVDGTDEANGKISCINDGIAGTTENDNPGALTFSTWNGSSAGERMRISSNGYVGIGTTSPATSLHLSGTTTGITVDGSYGTLSTAGSIRIAGSNVINFGYDQTKQQDSGKIGYQSFTPGCLDIVGAGTIPRAVKIYDNLSVNGTLTTNGSLNLGGYGITGTIGSSLQMGTSAPIYFDDSNKGIGYFGTNTGGSYFANSLPTDGIGVFGWSDGILGTKKDGNKVALSWDYYGQVSIPGTATCGSLKCNASNLNNGTNNFRYVNYSASQYYSNVGSANYNYSLWTTGNILCNGELNVTSDERIKTNINDLIGQDSLSTFRLIKPKSYNFIDIIKGDHDAYGFIAQELKQVLPHAVNELTEYIPNIFDCAVVTDGTIVKLDNKNTSKFETNKSGDPIKIKLFDVSNNEIFATITQIIDEKTFEITNAIDTSFIFVYGQEVSDCHSIKKDYVYTLTASAVQEIDNIVQKQHTIILDLSNNLFNQQQVIDEQQQVTIQQQAVIQQQQSTIQQQQATINTILQRLTAAGIA
jgi:hypothetical protein